MFKLRFLSVAALAILLAGCGADAPDTAPISQPIATPVKNPAPENNAPKQAAEDAAKNAAENAARQTAAFKDACGEKITAKMPDPSAAKISYRPLSGTGGFQAEVSLARKDSGEPLKFNYTCMPDANGGVVTQRVGD